MPTETACCAGGRYGNAAAALKEAITKAMWDTKSGHFCDGPCTDPKVDYHGGPTTNYFTMYLGQ